MGKKSVNQGIPSHLDQHTKERKKSVPQKMPIGRGEGGRGKEGNTNQIFSRSGCRGTEWATYGTLIGVDMHGGLGEGCPAKITQSEKRETAKKREPKRKSNSRGAGSKSRKRKKKRGPFAGELQPRL